MFFSVGLLLSCGLSQATTQVKENLSPMIGSKIWIKKSHMSKRMLKETKFAITILGITYLFHQRFVSLSSQTITFVTKEPPKPSREKCSTYST